jgi:hypothetical protein
MAESVIEKAIADLGINVPIYRIVADDKSLTFHLYGGRVVTWTPPDVEGDVPAYPPVGAGLKPAPGMKRDVQDVAGIGQRTAADLQAHYNVVTIEDLVNRFEAGELHKYLIPRTYDKAVAWLREHHYVTGEGA